MVVVYDLLTDTAHHLNPAAGTILLSCDGVSDENNLVDRLVEATGGDRSQVRRDVHAVVMSFADLGLVGRPDEQRPAGTQPPEATPAPPGWFTGPSFRIVDWRVTFCGPQEELLSAVASRLGAGDPCDDGVPLAMPIFLRDDGVVLVGSEGRWQYVDLESCLSQLQFLLVDFAISTTTCAVLHAGAVRSPDGEVVLLPGTPMSGKSTMTAAFVAAGWDYLGDEAIGVRPETCVAVGWPKRLRLGAVSREVLGVATDISGDVDPVHIAPTDRDPAAVGVCGDAGRVTTVIFPKFVAGSPVEVTRLGESDALNRLLVNTFNLQEAKEVALDAVCDLARSAVAHEIAYGDVRDGVDAAVGVVEWLRAS